MFSFYRKAILLASVMLFGLFSFAQNITVTVIAEDGSVLAGPFVAIEAAFGQDIVDGDEFPAFGEIALTADTTTLACDSLVNDLSCNTAVLDRGACEFGVKCLNAERAGATAVVVVTNNDDAPIVMGPGVFGGEVTIPCIMVSRADGQLIKDNLDNGYISIKSGSIPDVVYWGDYPGQGDFNGGLNGWTAVNYSACPADTLEGGFPLWKWSQNVVSQGGFAPGFDLVSLTNCNGGVIFDSGFYDNDGTQEEGTGPCPAPQNGALISPTIDLSSTTDAVNINVKFHQLVGQFQSAFYVGWSSDDGVTWDSIAINTDIELNMVADDVETVALPDSLKGNPNVRIKFTFDANYYFWALDDVRIVELDENSVNLEIANTDIIIPPYGSIPAVQLEADPTLFAFQPGASIGNNGFGPTVNTKLDANIVFGDDVVYTDSADLASVPRDTFSDLTLLSPFTPANFTVGSYLVSYSASSDNRELDESDNLNNSRFDVTTNAFAKSRWSNGEPVSTGSGITTGGGGSVEFIQAIRIPKGVGYQIDTISFAPFVGAGESLAGLNLEGYVYDWTDTNEDGIIGNDEILPIAFGFIEFPEEETARFIGTVSVSMIDFNTFEEGPIAISEDNKTYLVGVRYMGDRTVFFSYDGALDYTAHVAAKQAEGTFTEADYPYIGVTGWIDDLIPDIEQGGFLFTDFRSPFSVGLIVNELEVDVENILEEGTYEYIIYPSPVSEELTVEFKLKERTPFIEFRVIDAMGREVFRARENGFVTENTSTFNVSALPAGQYFLNVATQEGNVSKAFTKQ